MTGNNRQRTTRRTVLGAAGSVATAGLAGCVGGNDDETGDGNGTDSSDSNGDTDNGGSGDTTATVTLLAESTGPHEEGLPDDNISHACEHFEFGDSEGLAGTESPDGAPEISATHQLFDVTIEGEVGHIVFHDHDEEDEDGHDHDEEDEDGHDHEGDSGEGHEGGHDSEDENGHDHSGEAYAFFADGGSVSVVEGNTVHAANGEVPACGPADMYLIAEPDGEGIVLEVSA